MISFDKQKHEYRNNSNNRKYISVTTLVGIYEPIKDWVSIAAKYKVKHKKKESVEEILRSWHLYKIESAERGTIYHQEKEDEAFKESTVSEGYVEKLNLNDLREGIYPELRVYNDQYEIAGHVDRVEVFKNNVIDIEDYKTCRDKNNANGIRKMSFNDERMLYPLQMFPNSNYWHYVVQLNLYAWILKKRGYKPRSLTIRHKAWLDTEEIPNDRRIWSMTEEKQREERLYELPLCLDVIDKLMEHYASTRKD
jgi:hypothetical protein